MKRKPNIKALLVLKGLKQADLAKEIGVSRAFFSQVVSRVRTSVRVQRHISDAVGLKYELLWPRNGGKRAA